MAMRRTARLTIVFLLCSAISGLPSTAGSMIVGSAIAGSHAMVAEREMRPGATILNGDRVQVADGTALVSLEDGSRMTLGSNTVLSFETQPRGVKGVLEKGTVDFFHPATDSPTRLEIADVEVVPGSGFETFGAIAMTGDTLIVVTSKGSLRIQGGGESVDVPEGKMITLHSHPARAPQISATTARPAFVHDIKVGTLAVAGAVLLALLIDHLITNANHNNCVSSIEKLSPSLPTSICP